MRYGVASQCGVITRFSGLPNPEIRLINPYLFYEIELDDRMLLPAPRHECATWLRGVSGHLLLSVLLAYCG